MKSCRIDVLFVINWLVCHSWLIVWFQNNYWSKSVEIVDLVSILFISELPAEVIF